MIFSRKQAVFVTVAVWFCMSFYLLMKGILLLQSVNFLSFSLYFLPLGTLKGVIIMRKAADSLIGRIDSFGDKIPIRQLYNRRYYMLILAMALMGAILSSGVISTQWRGGIDVAIGVALLIGTIRLFNQRKKTCET